jgi:hypothetical protein
MALKAHIGGAFLNMANGATFNWSDIDVPDTLNTLRELASNNTLSEENRLAIREICWVTEQMRTQIQEQQALHKHSNVMAAGTGQ